MKHGDPRAAESGDLQGAEALLQSLLQARASAAEIAAALQVVERHDPVRRRRLQAELLHRRLTELAELAAGCGWQAGALARDGQALVEYDGAALKAEHGHFRASGQSPDAVLASTLDHFGVRPRVIVDLHAGAGEASILLARRFPRCRVIALESSRERLEGFDLNLGLQGRPIGNLEVAAVSPSLSPEAALRAMVQSGKLGRIDLLRRGAAPETPELAALIRALAGRITLACLTLAGPADQHAELLAAIEAAGLVLLEKRSQLVADPAAWLARNLKGRAPVAVWLAARGRLGRDGRRRPPSALGLLRDIGRDPGPLKGWVYGKLDRWLRSVDPTNLRFDFEKLYALKPDPWRYLTNPYETLKYRRTIETALRLRPDAHEVLEIGCSIGVFTRTLARSFPKVTAVDFAGEALKLDRRRVGRIGQVSYVRSDIRRLDLGRRHDLIFCAETLYYLPYDAAPAVLEAFERNLAPGGVVMTVMPHPFKAGGPDPFSGWRGHLMRGGLRLVSEEDFDDPVRPYLIAAFERGGGG